MRFWLLMFVVRLLGGGRWFPFRGQGLLILRGVMSDVRQERLAEALRPLGITVLVLPLQIAVEGVVTRWQE